MLTSTQLSALKAAAFADPTAAQYLTNGNDNELADWFNQPQTFVVWRSKLTPEQARAAIIKGATQLDGLTVGKRDSLFYLVSGDLDVSDAAVRTAIDDLCGTQNQLKGYLTAVQKRTTTRAEKILASGTGTDAAPANLGWEGWLSGNDSSDIRTAL